MVSVLNQLHATPPDRGGVYQSDEFLARPLASGQTASQSRMTATQLSELPYTTTRGMSRLKSVKIVQLSLLQIKNILYGTDFQPTRNP